LLLTEDLVTISDMLRLSSADLDTPHGIIFIYFDISYTVKSVGVLK